VLGAVNGKALQRVRYVVLPGSPEPAARASVVDEAEYAVEMVFDGFVVGIFWQMENELECLRVVRQEMGGVASGYSKIIDVSSYSGWSNRIGKKVAGFRASWHRPAFSEVECLWAFTVLLEDAEPATVALGELLTDVPSYLPDSLVVLFGQNTAQDFQLAVGSASAWGEELS
jgi:hypothetical protein